MNLIERLSSVSVKIVCEKDSLISIGSGTIISDGEKYYVMTVSHCIIRSATEYFQPEEIKIISYASSEPKEIRVLRIDERSRIADEEDFALLEIENPDINFNFSEQVKRCDDVVIGEDFHFYGFGGPKHSNSGRLFKIYQNGKAVWHLRDESIASQKLKAHALMDGFSGSGIFFEKMGVLYCVGMVKELYDHTGSYSDILSIPTSCFDGILAEGTKEKDYFLLLRDWDNIKKHSPICDNKDSYKENHVSYINNLKRKMEVLYPVSHEATEKMELHLDNLLGGLKINHYLSPYLLKELNHMEEEAYRLISDDRTNYYQTNRDAIHDLGSIKENLRKSLSDVFAFPGSDKSLLNNYVNYRIAVRLLDCSLNYIKYD